MAGITGAGGARGVYCQMCVCVWFMYAMRINDLINDFSISLLMNSQCMLITYVCMFSQGSVNFKFGVLYAKDGQLTDDEMFSNGEHRTTPNMLIILNILFVPFYFQYLCYICTMLNNNYQ